MKKPVIGTIGLCGQSVFLQVDHFHSEGETLHAEKIYTEPGGKASNQAVAAARLGADVFFVGAIGKDTDGKICESFLVKEGVVPLLLKSEKNTAYACILTDRNGANRVTVFKGAAEALSADYVKAQEEKLAACDVLLLGTECGNDAVSAAFDIAEKYDIPVVFNPAPAINVPQDFLRRALVITPNETEAAQLFNLGENAEIGDIAGALRENRIAKAAVTLGEKGALVFENGTWTVCETQKVKAVDTTGAGDTFNAALAVRLGMGDSLTEAAVYANRAASKSVMKAHVMESLPYKADLE